MQTETVDACPVCHSVQLAHLDTARCLRQCVACRFVFDSPRPTFQALEAFYSKPNQYDSWIEDEAARRKLWRRRLKLVLRHRKPGSIFDVGAGVGQFLHEASPYFSSLHGSEVSSSAIKIAREKYGIELRSGQVDNVDLGTRVSNVSLFHVLEHVPDPHRTLRACKELLQSDGMIFIAVPNELGTAKGYIKLLLGRCGVPRYRGHPGHELRRITLQDGPAEIHLSHFTVETLKIMLEDLDFEIVEITVDPYAILSGAKWAIDQVLRAICAALLRITGRNYYEATWVAARVGK